CQGCGCNCRICNDQSGLHLHAEIENLKQRLIEKEDHILMMETNFLKEAEKYPNGEMAAISEELSTWQEKYSRLYEAHKRVQKVNQNLEDKLLRIVDKCETEKNALTAEVSNLTRRLVDEKFNVSKLQEENERYRNDVNLAIQLLQCKPSNFVSQKYDSLPSDMQQKVRMYISAKRRQSDGNGNVTPKPEMKTIKVPIPTFPPTAMVYSINKGPVEKDLNSEEKNHQGAPPVDIVSAAIMAKVLEERERERAQTKHCDTCTCPAISNKQSKGTQTTEQVRDNSRHCRTPATSGALNVKSSRNLVQTEKPPPQPTSEQPPRLAGPRHCSVRMQVGTNNILLDNIVSPYTTPVLYKSRNADPLVHAPRSRSESSNSSGDEPMVVNNNGGRKSILRTETEI
ncbi:hypothetical protein AAG570_001159, partial [Ranatra chinensis]